jgi:inorganic pyrophosphatase
VETPKGSCQKYAYDKRSGLFKLKKILPVGMVFPFDFGLIPDTAGEDKDPLDALILSEFSSFPGCILECRLIGAILAIQAEDDKKIRNDRFFFVPLLSKQFSAIEEMSELPKKHRKEMEEFFVQYNRVEGKEFMVEDVIDSKKAFKLISNQHEPA